MQFQADRTRQYTVGVDAKELAAGRFRTTLDLFDTGLRLRREALRRAHPEASAARIEELVVVWLQARPGAEEGDGPPRSS
jgi:hypothetical protein